MNEDQHTEGLRERIAEARTPEDVTALLELGGTFTQASDRSRRAWRNTAARRLSELAKPAPVVEDRGALDKADKARREKLALHGMRYSAPISLGGLS